MADSDREIFDDIVLSVGYKTTVGPIDKSKVTKAINGQPSVRPAARLAQAAWSLARRINPPAPPPPPPPPPPKVAPRTYNKVLPNGSDARFCVEGLPRNANGRLYDVYSEYDDNGLSWGGRTPDTQVPGLKPANAMDGRGACDPYDNFPPWPVESYSR